MNTLLVIIVIVLVLYFEWDLIFTALAPLVDICVCAFFIAVLAVVIVIEAALVVIAPVALVFGYESRDWHVNAARKILAGRNKDES